MSLPVQSKMKLELKMATRLCLGFALVIGYQLFLLVFLNI